MILKNDGIYDIVRSRENCREKAEKKGVQLRSGQGLLCKLSKNRLHKPQAAFVLPYPPHFSQTAISSSSPAEAVFGKTISSSTHSTG